MHKAKAMIACADQCQADLIELQSEARCIRDDLEPHLSDLRQRLLAIQDKIVPGNPKLGNLSDLRHCHYIRTYSLGLAIAIFINEIQLALSIDPWSILSESNDFATEIVNLAEVACQYRPLGASPLSLCLIAAELGASDINTKAAAQQLRLKYDQDFRGPETGAPAQDLRLVCGRHTLLAQIFD